jgi:hypothetical protein
LNLYVAIPRLRLVFLVPAFFGLPWAPYQAIQQSCHQSGSPSAKLLNTLWVASEKSIHTIVVDLSGPNCLAKKLDLGWSGNLVKNLGIHYPSTSQYHPKIACCQRSSRSARIVSKSSKIAWAHTSAPLSLVQDFSHFEAESSKCAQASNGSLSALCISLPRGSGLVGAAQASVDLSNIKLSVV